MAARANIGAGLAHSPDDKTCEAGSEHRGDHPALVAFWDGGGTTVLIPKSATSVVGRDREADIVLGHGSVSRRHARIEVREDGIVWEDLGSVNGTRIRGKPLSPGERVAVAWGEAVEVGFTVVVVRGPGGRPVTTASTSPAMEQVEEWIQIVAGTEMAVLLLGETGVGKGFFARRIHDASLRARGPFVHINCAAIPENLVESELFGYERGAFTGATQAKVGLLESANGGTVFFDEVGELPLPTQAKLLVAIERREVLRVGALQPRPFDARLVSATNRSIGAETSREMFRQDLYYRLAGLPIVIPPLRERASDIPGLARTFTIEAAKKLRRSEPVLSEEAIEALRRHAWPGNVRELMTAIERAVLLSKGVIGQEEIGRAMLAGGAPGAARPAAAAPSPDATPKSERDRILAVLDECGGNQSRAAKVLGIARRTLINRIEEYGLRRPRK